MTRKTKFEMAGKVLQLVGYDPADREALTTVADRALARLDEHRGTWEAPPHLTFSAADYAANAVDARRELDSASDAEAPYVVQLLLSSVSCACCHKEPRRPMVPLDDHGAHEELLRQVADLVSLGFQRAASQFTTKDKDSGS